MDMEASFGQMQAMEFIWLFNGHLDQHCRYRNHQISVLVSDTVMMFSAVVIRGIPMTRGTVEAAFDEARCKEI